MFKKYIAFSLLCCFLFSCKKNIENADVENNSTSIDGKYSPLANFNSTTATYFDSIFTRYGGGFTGGDVAYSHVLPDGRSFWLFGDSFLDTVYPDRHRPRTSFIHNMVVVTDPSGGFTTLHGGTTDNPLPFFVAADPNQYYWPNCAFINKKNSLLYVILVRIEPNGEGGIFGFDVKGNDIAILSLPDLTLKKIVPFSDGAFIDWSSATLEDDDNYIYLYGVESTKRNKYMHIARTKAGGPLNKFEFYNGTTWVNDMSQTARVFGGLSEQYSVFKSQGKYYLLSEGNLLSPDIYLYDAAGPVGPFTNRRKIYTAPQAGGNIIAYNATAHTEFNNNDSLLVGYSINSTNFRDLFTNADNYRPYFFWLGDWR
ncbi:MAG: hypothetical protein ABI653_02915 [Bacteroidota bacterium]